MGNVKAHKLCCANCQLISNRYQISTVEAPPWGTYPPSFLASTISTSVTAFSECWSKTFEFCNSFLFSLFGEDIRFFSFFPFCVVKHFASSVMTTPYFFKPLRAMYSEQRKRLGAAMLKKGFDATHAAIFQAAAEVPVNSTDTCYLFRQESYFEYFFGYQQPDCFGAVFPDGTGCLFIPKLPADFAVWMGVLPTTDSVRLQTELENVQFVSDISDVLKARGVTTLHVMDGTNSDSQLKVLSASFAGIEAFAVEKAFLFHAASTQRTVKTALEGDLLQYVCKVSSDAHISVMQACKPGMSQHQLEARFLHDVYAKGGCRRVSYTCICATGHDGAILHYPNNDKPVEDGTMALLDMGGEYMCYASDITCSFPINGKFTPNQKIIYNGVLAAHDAVMRHVKPGVSWVSMHKLALRVLSEKLIAADIVRGTPEEIAAKHIMRVFLPHGLGHLVGLDVHDVGGYLTDTPARPTEPDCTRLRTARILEAGFYITIEPGCYFNHVLLEAAFKNPEVAPHLNEPKIRAEFWNFGGVRIESDVLVTNDGVMNFTIVPRTVEEIEATMAGTPFSGQIQRFVN